MPLSSTVPICAAYPPEAKDLRKFTEGRNTPCVFVENKNGMWENEAAEDAESQDADDEGAEDSDQGSEVGVIAIETDEDLYCMTKDEFLVALKKAQTFKLMPMDELVRAFDHLLYEVPKAD